MCVYVYVCVCAQLLRVNIGGQMAEHTCGGQRAAWLLIFIFCLIWSLLFFYYECQTY